MAIIGISMLFLYIKKYKGLSFKVWKPGAAWIRSFIYFSVCNVIIAASGTLEHVLSQPLFTEVQILNTL